MLQYECLHREFDQLQRLYGDRQLYSIYGAGRILKPKYCFVFMNPTSKNVSAKKEWNGLRAPWIGTKNVWSLFYELGLLEVSLYKRISEIKASDWTPGFAVEVYENLAVNSVYVTNLAKCTQVDASPLPNTVFRAYLPLFQKEIALVKPTHIIAFGNQVSSIILQKKISVSEYLDGRSERFDRIFPTHPIYYPVGQGRRNQPLAVRRIKQLF